MAPGIGNLRFNTTDFSVKDFQNKTVNFGVRRPGWLTHLLRFTSRSRTGALYRKIK